MTNKTKLLLLLLGLVIWATIYTIEIIYFGMGIKWHILHIGIGAVIIGFIYDKIKAIKKIKALEKKYEEKVYNFIKERTLIGLGTSVKDLKEGLKEVFEGIEYKIHNKLLRLKNNSRIYESGKEIYYTKNS